MLRRQGHVLRVTPALGTQTLGTCDPDDQKHRLRVTQASVNVTRPPILSRSISLRTYISVGLPGAIHSYCVCTCPRYRCVTHVVHPGSAASSLCSHSAHIVRFVSSASIVRGVVLALHLTLMRYVSRKSHSNGLVRRNSSLPSSLFSRFTPRSDSHQK